MNTRDPRVNPAKFDMLLTRVGDTELGAYVTHTDIAKNAQGIQGLYVYYMLEGWGRVFCVSIDDWCQTMKAADVLRATPIVYDAPWSDHGAMGWRPIFTAPRDGTKILCIVEEGRKTVCWFDRGRFVEDGDMYNYVCEPTQWHPLP